MIALLSGASLAVLLVSSCLFRNGGGSALTTFTMPRTDELGLDMVDRRMLKAMIDYYNGGPVGLDTLAATTGEDAVTIEDVYEPYLMQLGFLMRTPRGRICTPAAWTHMKKNMPATAEAQIRMEI